MLGIPTSLDILLVGIKHRLSIFLSLKGADFSMFGASVFLKSLLRAEEAENLLFFAQIRNSPGTNLCQPGT